LTLKARLVGLLCTVKFCTSVWLLFPEVSFAQKYQPTFEPALAVIVEIFTETFDVPPNWMKLELIQLPDWFVLKM
jgi:hypothetical protein